MSKKLYSYKEVAKHKVDNDIWIVIHGSVYNLTKFLREHPGGDEVLIKLAGGDGTDCFDAVGHSPEALQRRELYKIGEIDPTIDRNDDGAKTGTDGQQHGSANDGEEEPWDYVEHEEVTSPWLFIFLGLGALVYAFIFYHIL